MNRNKGNSSTADEQAATSRRRRGARAAGLGSLAALTLVTVGCGSDDDATDISSISAAATPTTITTTPSTTVPPSSPPDESQSEQPTIAVSAVGTARGVPDEVTVTMGVEVFALTTADVLEAVSAKSDALVTYLRGAGVSEQDLQTANLFVYPMYDYSQPGPVPGPPTITGYQAGVTVYVTIRDIDQASTIVDGAAFAVGDALRLQGLGWSIKDSDQLLATARADAIEKAKVQADQFAAAADLTVGAIVSIDEQPGSATEFRGEGDGAGIPFSPGTDQLQVTVRVVFAASPA